MFFEHLFDLLERTERMPATKSAVASDGLPEVTA